MTEYQGWWVIGLLIGLVVIELMQLADSLLYRFDDE